MKTASRTQYGSPEAITIKEINVPVPRPNEILVRVQAATVNRTDCAILQGKPAVMRLMHGLTKPRQPVLGTDFAGVVEVIGKNVTTWQVGDRVWGFNDNGLASHAEYLTIAADKAVEWPKRATFPKAAACGEAAHYAYNFINKVTLKPGQTALVNGGTSAIGSALIQMLKKYGLYVNATCKGEHAKQVESLGADRTIDYLKEDFTQDAERYDFIFDAVGKSSFGACKGLLKENGIYISSELGPRGENTWRPLTTKLGGGKRIIFPFPANIRRSLLFVKEMFEEGTFKPLIDRQFPLEQARDAYEYVLTEQKVGNVILDLSEKRHG